MAHHKIKLEYPHSKAWLIFWMIAFFPVALVLLVTAARFRYQEKEYLIQYDGSRGWLAFWTLVLFPVAIALFLLNGVGLVVEERSRELTSNP